MTANTEMLAERSLMFIVVFICLAVLFFAVRMFVADISNYQATRFVANWELNDQDPSESAWSVARDAAARAVSSYPVDNGAYYYRLGKVYQLRYEDRWPGAGDAHDTRSRARDAYRRSVAARPDSPYGWVRLARLKMQLLEFDAEFDRALRQAIEKGPWRWRVNYEIGQIGLIAWNEITPDQRQLIVSAIARLEKANPKEAKKILAYAERRQLRDDLQGLQDPLLQIDVSD